MTFLPVKRLTLPGRARTLHERGETRALVAELGDNYAAYHRFLEGEFDRIGGVPQPSDFGDDYDAYCKRFAELQEVVVIEVALRRARAYRSSGARLDAVPDGPPIVDGGGSFTGLPPL